MKWTATIHKAALLRRKLITPGTVVVIIISRWNAETLEHPVEPTESRLRQLKIS